MGNMIEAIINYENLRNLEIRPKISKSNSHGIRPKFLYPRNQQESLNHLDIFNNEIFVSRKKLSGLPFPEYSLDMGNMIEAIMNYENLRKDYKNNMQV